MPESNRRQFLAGMGSAVAVGAAGCLENGDDDDTILLQLPEGTIHYPLYEAALDEGFFEAEGLDVEIEYPPFDAQVQSITADEVDTTMVSMLPYINNHLQGEDLITFGWDGTLQSVNAMYCLAERDYETIADLEGDRIAPWSWGSSTVQAFEAVVAQQFGLNLQQDFETTTAAPPALLGLLEDGEVDAIINVSGLTITMESQPDTYRNLGQLNDMWIDETGHTLPLTSWWAYEDWYDENTEVAASLLRAARNATEHWRENTRPILEEYGENGGVEEDAEIDVVDEWANEGQVFNAETTDDYVDATWQFVELVQEEGFIDEVPDREDVIRDPS